MILLETLSKKHTSATPIWLMRQAGRYLPEYRAIRERASSFLDLVLTPELATKITLQPIQRFGFDAAIVFSDILIVPYGLGQDVQFREGIHMSDIDFENLVFDKDLFNKKIAPTLETITSVRRELSKEKALIGFCGGPFTVLCYMLEGTNQTGFPKARSFAFSKEKTFNDLLETIVQTTTWFLCKQIEAGANVVQIFETWASLVPWQRQEDWITLPLKKIIEGVRNVYPNFPVIVYLKGVGQMLKNFEKKTKVTALSLDSTYALKDTEGFSCVLQGNLDPQILLEGGSFLEEAVCEIKNQMKNKSFVFNLGHGILPGTPIEHVEKLVHLVKKS